jgi:hypothetical protein
MDYLPLRDFNRLMVRTLQMDVGLLTAAFAISQPP